MTSSDGPKVHLPNRRDGTTTVDNEACAPRLQAIGNDEPTPMVQRAYRQNLHAIAHVRPRTPARARACATPKAGKRSNIAKPVAPLRFVEMSAVKRSCAAVAATACWFALLLQLYATVQVSRIQGGGTLQGVWTFLGFFTVLTNLLAAALLTIPLLAPRSAAGRFFARADTLAGVSVNIALVCIIYNLLLRNAGNLLVVERVADELLHDGIPPLFVAYAWWKAGSSPVALMPRLRWAIWPMLYFAYALLRGAGTGFYPYPFMDVAGLGYVEVLRNGIGLLAGYALLAAMLHRLDRVRWRPFVFDARKDGALAMRWIRT